MVFCYNDYREWLAEDFNFERIRNCSDFLKKSPKFRLSEKSKSPASKTKKLYDLPYHHNFSKYF